MIENYEEVVKKIITLILTNQQKVIREEDLKKLYDFSSELDFNKIFYDVFEQLNNFGFELIKTEFQGSIYYVLTSEGKDDNVTPSQYGTLAIIIALSKEVDENIKIEDLKEIFNEIWDTDIQFLIENDYLRKFDELGIIRVAPLGKAIMKNIIVDIQLKNLLNLFKE